MLKLKFISVKMEPRQSELVRIEGSSPRQSELTRIEGSSSPPRTLKSLPVLPTSFASRLPKGFENLPREIWEKILLNPELSWSEVARGCSTNSRILRICEERIWPLKQQSEIPTSNPTDGLYQSSFYNYLAASVQENVRQIREIEHSREYQEDGQGDPEVEALEKQRINDLTLDAENKSAVLGDYLHRTYPGYYLFKYLDQGSVQVFLDYYNEAYPDEGAERLSDLHKNKPQRLKIGGTDHNINFYELWSELVPRDGIFVYLSDPQAPIYFVANMEQPGVIQVQAFNKKTTAEEKFRSGSYNPKWPDEIGVTPSFDYQIRQLGLTSRVASDLFGFPEDLIFKLRSNWL